MPVLVINPGRLVVLLKTIDNIGVSPASGSERDGMLIELVNPYAIEID